MDIHATAVMDRTGTSFPPPIGEDVAVAFVIGVGGGEVELEVVACVVHPAASTNAPARRCRRSAVTGKLLLGRAERSRHQMSVVPGSVFG
jgi:hypothetical protein